MPDLLQIVSGRLPAAQPLLMQHYRPPTVPVIDHGRSHGEEEALLYTFSPDQQAPADYPLRSIDPLQCVP